MADTITTATRVNIRETAGVLTPLRGGAGSTISGASTSLNTFTVASDITGNHKIGEYIDVTGSAANDGAYAITDISYTSPNTTITVASITGGEDGAGTLRAAIQVTAAIHDDLLSKLSDVSAVITKRVDGG